MVALIKLEVVDVERLSWLQSSNKAIFGTFMILLNGCLCVQVHCVKLDIDFGPAIALWLVSSFELPQNTGVTSALHFFFDGRACLLVFARTLPLQYPDNLISVLDELADEFGVFVVEELHEVVLNFAQRLRFSRIALQSRHDLF